MTNEEFLRLSTGEQKAVGSLLDKMDRSAGWALREDKWDYFVSILILSGYKDHWRIDHVDEQRHPQSFAAINLRKGIIGHDE